MEDPFVSAAISRSYTEPRKPGNLAFQTYTEQLPIFTSIDVHTGYVGKFCTEYHSVIMIQFSWNSLLNYNVCISKYFDYTVYEVKVYTAFF